jgi:transcriptional regulator with XRE-family HTH domain
LRQSRQRTSLSRETLARLSGCSTSRIAQFEQGLRPDASPVLERVWGVIEALLDEGVTPNAGRRRLVTGAVTRHSERAGLAVWPRRAGPERRTDVLSSQQ